MSHLRLLLIEDNEDDTLLILRELKRGGHDVHYERVESEDEMRRALAHSEWDLIISDFSLPAFSGPRALAVLKESGRDIPFLIASGTVGEETAVAALKAGAHDFLSKNNLNRLLPAIDRELREAAGRVERRDAEKRLRKSEEALAAVFDSSPLPIITIDMHKNVTGLNKAAEGAFGVKADDVAGRKPEFIHKTNDTGDWVERVLSGEILDRTEVTAERADGNEMQMLLFASPLHDAGDEVTGGVAILNDVTTQRALEEQLRQAQKMEAIGRLAGGVAHDFNNILTAIQGYATLMQDSMPANSEYRNDIEGILEAAARAASFTRQLLAFSRKQVTQPELLSANELIDSVMNMLRRVIGASYTLEFEAGEKLDPIFADRGQMGQILLNLVVNARDAMEGGGTIRIRTERVTKCPSHPLPPDNDAGAGPYIAFRVSDTGHGIKASDIQRIFEPFFTTKDTTKGTGLGLSTVYGIVTSHDGFLTVDSEPGVGTTFSVYLPERAGTRPAGHATTVRDGQRDTQGSHILVVEDDEVILRLIERTLKRAGFHVMSAPDATVALDIMRSSHVDVVVTDLMLPETTGLELIDQLKTINPTVKSVLMSGYSAEDLELGPDYTFMEKPFAPAALVTTIQSVLAANK
jgi:PAS domain S-box-containing protein